MNNSNIDTYINRHNDFLNRVIINAKIPAIKLKNAILYSLFPGGKRFRPVLVYLCGELLNIKIEILDILAAAIELIHCFSLVHDDLPAMDNDDYRRNKLSCHKAFDEATAILAGDAMQTLALDILINMLPKYLDSLKVLKICRVILEASGPSGMLSGQSLDMSELNKDSLDEQTLTNIHSLKTGKLIAACTKMTLIVSEVTPEIQNSLNEFAEQLGILFQMQDDYLDKYGNNGKLRSSDKDNNKYTFANIYTAEGLLDKIQNKYSNLLNILNIFPDKTLDLKQVLHNLQAKVIDIGN